MEDDTYPCNDAEEFKVILKCLDDIELKILHKTLELKEEKERRAYIREQVRENNKFHDGKLYNAYFARVLVSDPIAYIKSEIISRFTKRI